MSSGKNSANNSKVQQQDQERDLYEVLGVAKTATEDEIRKAFRSMSRKYHPDINKEADAEERFKEINQAHEILKDAQKREIYDKYGMKGIKEGAPMSGGFDIFEQMFNPGMRRGPQGPVRSESVKEALTVTLEELYNGATRKVRITRTRNCGSCKGIGASSADAVKKCKTCDGVGVVNRVVQLAPGFITQSRAHCPDCKGQGESVDKSKICQACQGNKVTAEKKTLEVHIDKGMKMGQKVVFEGEADERPGVQPGDVIFILQEKQHQMFQREDKNLICQKKISLVEALTGVEFKLTHLDGRILLVKSKTGDVVKPGQIKQIDNEGMPVYKAPYEKGNLYIKFEIEFPKTLPQDMADKLQKILPPKQAVEPTKDEDKEKIEEVEMTEAEVANKKQHGHFQQGEAYDEDEDGSQEQRGGISCGPQ